MWCWLVKNGIGGKTIAEAKAALTFDEYQIWAAYIKKYGALTIEDILDRGFALQAHLICVSKKIKINNRIPTVDDFMMRKPKEEVAPVCTDVNVAFSFLKGLKKRDGN